MSAELSLRLDGAVALVTGGAGGIGAAIVESLVSAGAQVTSADLQHADLQHAAELGPAQSAGLARVRCDVSKSDELRALVEGIVAKHDALDLVVHCAGITRDGISWKMPDEDWAAVMRVNLDSAFYLMKAAAPWLRKSTRGAAVMISSINGQRGKLGQVNYAASKAGLIGLARSLARELGRDGARVNVVAPGFITTKMTAAMPQALQDKAIAETVLGRAGRPEDVAAAVLFLCSDLSRHISGQVLRVDGGQVMA